MIDVTRPITIRDCKKQKMCRWGIEYFLASVGLTMEDFKRGNVTVNTLLQSKHAMATKFVENLDAD